jgi:hypothetical protein
MVTRGARPEKAIQRERGRISTLHLIAQPDLIDREQAGLKPGKNKRYGPTSADD